MYISLPNEIGLNYTTPTEGTLDKSPMVDLYQRIAASSETLENIVFHQVGDTETLGSRSLLTYSAPMSRMARSTPHLHLAS
jgi:hypothetical protein